VLPEVTFVIGSTRVAVSLHGLAVVVAVTAGTAFAGHRAREAGSVLATAALVAVAALTGAHAFHRMFHGGPGGLWSGGLASTGGIAAGLAAAVAAARLLGRSAAETLDAIVPAGLLALGIGRIGCFLGGCCFGRPTDLPWAVVLPDLGPPPRHPLQLYAAAGDLGLVLLLAHRRGPVGAVASRILIGFGLLRTVLETLRDPAATDLLPGGWLTVPQGAALVLVAAGTATVLRLRHMRASTMAPARRTRAHG
jgi:phosphatidylglycerol:prolipoprotein diacylglycerol transferase